MKSLSFITLLLMYFSVSFSAMALPIAQLNPPGKTNIEWASVNGQAPVIWMQNADVTSIMEPQINDDDLEDGIADEESATYDFEQWIWAEAAQRPTLFMENVEAKDKAKLVVEVSKGSQTGKVWYNGELLIKSFKLSTGMRGSETPVGTFKPGARSVNWRSNFASKKYGRSIFLKWAVQISGGSFMHAASTGAMNYMGQKRSSGCVRVPPGIAAKVYKLINQNGGRAVFYVH